MYTCGLTNIVHSLYMHMFQESSLVQWRALRHQQDREYQESLRKDQEKVIHEPVDLIHLVNVPMCSWVVNQTYLYAFS